MLLIDSSIPPQQIDLDVAGWFAESQVPFSIVFTKLDKDVKVRGFAAAPHKQAHKAVHACPCSRYLTAGGREQ